VNTDIEYLQQLEADLQEVAAREAAGTPHMTATPARRRSGGMWARVAGVAAAFLVVAAMIGFFAGVGSFSASESAGSGAGADAPRRAVGSLGGAGDGGDGLGFAPGAPSPTTAPPGEELGPQGDLSKIIRDGRIGIVVSNGSFDDAVGDVTLIAEQSGGFVLSSSTTNDRSGTFVLRIPADRFDRARDQIRDLGLRVHFEQVTGDDVTAEFIDYQARLRILQQRKARLTALADQADTTAEILALGRQIDEVQLRIEQIQGQLRFLNDQVAESTLRVSIKERNAPAPAAVAVVDQPNLGSSLDLAVQGFLRIVSAVIVGLGYLVPLSVIALLVWLVVLTVRRRRAPA
jgi:hypothetical protein